LAGELGEQEFHGVGAEAFEEFVGFGEAGGALHELGPGAGVGFDPVEVGVQAGCELLDG